MPEQATANGADARNGDGEAGEVAKLRKRGRSGRAGKIDDLRADQTNTTPQQAKDSSQHIQCKSASLQVCRWG